MINRESLNKFAEATNNELFDLEYKGGEWMCDNEETHETLDQWVESSKLWHERSKAIHGEIAGFKFICWEKAQIVKGAQRSSISVIDFGNIRCVLKGTKLSYFA